jgi:hypothetical protein
MINIYEITFTKRNCDIEENETQYCKAECIEDAYFEFMASLTTGQPVDDKFISELLKDLDRPFYKSKDDERITMDDEVYDDIMHGGMWIYYDLQIRLIKEDDMPCSLIISQKDLNEISFEELKTRFVNTYIQKAEPCWFKFLETHPEVLLWV